MNNLQRTYNATREESKNWSQGAIDNLADESIPYEDLLRRRMNSITPYSEEIESRVAAGKTNGLEKLIWRLNLVTSPAGQMAPNDHLLAFELPVGRDMIALGTVDSECGLTQDDWCDCIPSKKRWPHGLNVLSRKGQGMTENLFFLKHSKALESAFCIDCRWFQREVNNGNITAKHVNNAFAQAGVNTDDIMWPVRWPLVRQESYDFNTNRSGGLVLVEYNRWSDMWMFMLDRLGFLDANGCPDWGGVEIEAKKRDVEVRKRCEAKKKRLEKELKLKEELEEERQREYERSEKVMLNAARRMKLEKKKRAGISKIARKKRRSMADFAKRNNLSGKMVVGV